ncbi:MAG: (2Fe-2S) ferredoxin domain-containing protein, partial [Anaerovorax sp.]
MKVIVGQGSCGVATGAKKTATEFEKQIKEKGLGIQVGKTGCVGTCYLEPIVDIYDDEGSLETRYVKVQPDMVSAIVENHLEKGQPVKDMEISEVDKTFVGKQ